MWRIIIWQTKISRADEWIVKIKLELNKTTGKINLAGFSLKSSNVIKSRKK